MAEIGTLTDPLMTVEPLRTLNVTVASLTVPAVLVTVALSVTVCDDSLYEVDLLTAAVVVVAAPTVSVEVAVTGLKSAVPL